jgi:hypothetical protein
MVTVTVDGDYYCDTDDLARHLSDWIQGALDDRDDIDAFGWSKDGIDLRGGPVEIERVKVAQP